MSVISAIPFPTDRICKFKALGGLALIFGSIVPSLTDSLLINREAFRIQKMKGDGYVDFEHWYLTIEDRENTTNRKQQLELLKMFPGMDAVGGPIDPLTDQEKQRIRDDLKRLNEQNPNVQTVDPENLIATQELMRSLKRNAPPPGQLDAELERVNKRLAEYVAQEKEITELGKSIDKRRNEIKTDEIELASRKKLNWWFWAGTAIAVVVGIYISVSGFRKWAMEEAAQALAKAT